MITTDKVTEIFCILDEFCKNLDAELTKNLHIAPIDEGYKRMRNRKGQMSKSEIIKLMPLWDKMMLRKRYIIECINELLKNKTNLVHSRHRSVHNFLMNLCAALAAYCFFENKPEALPVRIEKTRQLELF